MPYSLFKAIIILNIAAVIILTIVILYRSRRYTVSTFLFMLVLLWSMPVFGVVAVLVLMRYYTLK